MSNERHELQQENERLRAELAQLRTRVGGTTNSPPIRRFQQYNRPTDLPAAIQEAVFEDQRQYRVDQGDMAKLAEAVPKRLGDWIMVPKLEPVWKQRIQTATVQSDAILEQAQKRQRAVCDGLIAILESCHQLHRGELSFDELEGQLVHMFVLNAHFTAKLSDERRSNILRGAKIPTEWHNTFHQLADRTGEKLFDGDCFTILKQHDEEQRHIRQLAVEERKLKQANKPKNDRGQWHPGKKKFSQSSKNPTNPKPNSQQSQQ
ncbi:hypothetical protein H4R35_007326 [Dimargaris xerosporica]|nr:hypothetical protein H4R35_007326 [Dimargaris xerosporica]